MTAAGRSAHMGGMRPKDKSRPLQRPTRGRRRYTYDFLKPSGVVRTYYRFPVYLHLEGDDSSGFGRHTPTDRTPRKAKKFVRKNMGWGDFATGYHRRATRSAVVPRGILRGKNRR